MAILGAGESGLGAALLALKVGDIPFVSDNGSISAQWKAQLETYKIRFEEGGHTIERLAQADLIVKSPGIPSKVSVIRNLLKMGKEVIGELEYAYRHCQSRIIAITGSNGKTTTTNLTHHLLKENGFSVVKGGNYGESFSRCVADYEFDWIVLEVSSFQLDDIIDFKPNIGAILNITADHLDRYDYDFSKYAQSKKRITRNMSWEDQFFYRKGDSVVEALIEDLTGRLAITALEPLAGTLRKVCGKSKALRGDHNLMNAAFACAFAGYLGISESALRGSLETFRNDPHRLETVAIVNGVEWVNDSKATNVDAVMFALTSFRQPIIWIAGGIDKGNDYGLIKEAVRRQVKGLICLGIDNERVKEAFGDIVPQLAETQSMEEAIDTASKWAAEGDVVLLSPACASFDLFKNYKDRGEKFAAAVWNQLRKQH